QFGREGIHVRNENDSIGVGSDHVHDHFKCLHPLRCSLPPQLQVVDHNYGMMGQRIHDSRQVTFNASGFLKFCEEILRACGSIGGREKMKLFTVSEMFLSYAPANRSLTSVAFPGYQDPPVTTSQILMYFLHNNSVVGFSYNPEGFADVGATAEKVEIIMRQRADDFGIRCHLRDDFQNAVSNRS